MLDTSVCIGLIRRRPIAMLERLQSHAVGDVGVSVITLAELEYGVSKSSDPRRNRDALSQFVAPLEVATYDAPATVTYGRIRAALEKLGTSIGAMDLLIAAHALSLRVVLASANEREFRRVPGLRVEGWTS
jgi:tRNA(fMet)-specific endonuclease VapC